MTTPLVRTHAFQAPSQRLPLGVAVQRVERALARVTEDQDVEPYLLRRVLARALVGVIRDAFGERIAGLCPGRTLFCGEVLVGLQGGRRRVVFLDGQRVAVSLTDPPQLCPHSTTLLWRYEGMVHVAHDARFGLPTDLRMAAASLETDPELPVAAIEAVVCELGRALETLAPVAAFFVPEETGWDAFRFLEVRARALDPRTEIGLERARALEPDSQIGDLVGLNLPHQDWLTPLLCWIRGAG